MRSICWLAGLTATLTLFSACGSDGSGVNTPPEANFTQQCTNLVCIFDDTSIDDGAISTWNWNFGDPNSGANNLANVENPTHEFSAANSYNVSLTVTDADGGTSTKVNPVTVTAGTPANVPPTASFAVPTTCVAGADCAFHSGGTDTDGVINLHHWEFSDGGTADGIDVTHRYTAAGTFNVTLTVTDDDGALSVPVTQPITVAAASQECTPAGTASVDCILDITARANVRITLAGRDCELVGSRVTVPAVPDNVFLNVCSRPLLEQHIINNATGAFVVFPAGTQVAVRFTQGAADEGEPLIAPAGKLEGTFPNWTMTFDDGGNPINEPGFHDNVILTITAIPR